MTLEEINELNERVDNPGDSKHREQQSFEYSEEKALKEEVDEQVKKTDPLLFDKDGELITDANELASNRAAVWENIKDRKVLEAIRGWANIFKIGGVEMIKKLRSGFSFITHLGTVLNKLDGRGNFLTKNIYDALNNMSSAFLKGRQAVNDSHDEMAKKIGFKSYKDFSRTLRGKIILEGIKSSEGKKLGDKTVSLSQALWYYALSLNETQRTKLKRQGIDDKAIDKIKKALDPRAIAIAEAMVEKMTNESYNEMNSVYSAENGVDLKFIPNYFPSKTISTGKANDVKGDFLGRFEDNIEGLLRAREGSDADINLDGGDFLGLVNEHVESTQRYKAMSAGVKRISMIVNIPSVKALLNESKVTKAVNTSIESVINPEALLDAHGVNTRGLDTLFNKFVGAALANKAWQIPKQMSSFIFGFQGYNYKKRTGDEGFLKGLGLSVVDFAAFSVSSAKTLFFLRTNHKDFYENSPQYRERVDSHVKGRTQDLATGRDSKTFFDENSGLGDIMMWSNRLSGSTTALGDILGVAGFMAAYRQNIKNGMPKAEAMRLFEDYNKTQQSKRGTERTSLQQKSNFFIRSVAAFTSSQVLYTNNIIQAIDSIKSSETAAERAPHLRKLFLNASVGPAFFYAAAHIFQFAKGDEEDKEDFIEGLIEAAKFYPTLTSVPAIGIAVELATSDKPWAGDMGTNPIKGIWDGVADVVKDDEKSKARVGLKVFEYILGTNLDPIIDGVIYNEDDDMYYEALGVSPSKQPGGGKKSKSKKKGSSGRGTRPSSGRGASSRGTRPKSNR